MTPESLLARTCTHILRALAAWLDKAEAQFPPSEAEALLSARLADDMFPLSTQVRFACVQAQEGVYRLRGKAFPPAVGVMLAEGRDAPEKPGTLAQARDRIAQTLAVVATMSETEQSGAPDRPIVHVLPDGMTFDLTAESYVRDWVIAQFYFHVMTAYAILRHRGVALGKADFAAHMFAHVRPDSLPAQ